MTGMLDRMAELNSLFLEANFEEIELTGPEGTIRLVRKGTVVESHFSDAPDDIETVWAEAPSVGVFLDRHPLQDKPLVEIGQIVERDALVGYMRLGLVLIQVTSPVAGRVVVIKASHLAPTGYGDRLIEIEPLLEGLNG